MKIFTSTAIFGVIYTFLLEVECQLEIDALLEAQQTLNGGGGGRGSGIGRVIAHGIRSSFVNTALNGAVKFIVGETATPSPEMVNYGMAMRSEPRNQAERDVYVEMMKRVARRTPEVVRKYTKTETHKNGTKSHTVDFIALDADIIRKSILYANMRAARRQQRERERQQQAQHQLEINILHNLRDMRMGALYGAGIGTTPLFFDNFGTATPSVDINLLGSFGQQTTPSPALSANSVGGNYQTAG
ncbi:uncharacterized protein LOC128545833 [Mercenaria mercenaria]|uniref:uncharacterized protein LOC128545833 n=1 Tax=Mercenaria mercenaria TaxID=6596 RepID=UPI00234EBC88|nr:uncharacterized protein LOC128545833 [Mercenaria mercenaria]